MDGTSVVVVGGGFGGLSAACYLADAGADVTIVEKNDGLGGLDSPLAAEGFRFDTGPTWYMMPEAFGRFLAAFDRSPADYYWLKRLDPSYRVHYKDGDSIDVTTDRSRLRAVRRARGGSGRGARRVPRRGGRTYEQSMEAFVYTDRPRLRDWIGRVEYVAGGVGLQLWGSLDDHVERFFDDQRLRQLVQYAAVFLGGSPPRRRACTA